MRANVDGALARLAARRGRVPFVAQLEAADCGAACVTMVLRYHGVHAALDQVRALVGAGREGVDAPAIVRGAAALGLRGRVVRIEVDDLRHLPRGAILHWEFNHFVVLDRAARRTFTIVDPGYGRRVVPSAKVCRSFTGFAILLEPTRELPDLPRPERLTRRYLRQVLREGRLLVGALTTSVALRGLALALPFLVGIVVDLVVPRGDDHLLAVLALGAAAIVSMQFFAGLIRSTLLLELRTRLDTRMTLGFLDHLVSLPWAFFQDRPTGDLVMRVAGNTAIRERLTTALLSSLLDGVLVALSLALAFALAPPLAGLAVGLGALQVAIYALSRRRVRELMSQDLESQARAQSFLVQMLAGMETLKSAGAELRAVEQWSNLYVDQLNVALSRGRLDAWTAALRGLLAAAAPLALLGCGALMVLNDSLSLGTMLAVNSMAIGFLQPLDSLVDAALSLTSVASYIERLEDVMAATAEQDPSSRRPAPRLSGRIEVRGLCFRYGPNSPPVVRAVDLVVPAGSLLAIVGRTGSGKSTLARLLVGLHRPDQGAIFYDDHNLAELELGSLRRQLGIVPQHPHLFAGSIRSNLALGDLSVPHERVVAAARRACIHDDIRAMAMGYETPVADGGANLSGGQRQRLALARALVHDPSMLLLDEATSSLDAASERAVTASLAGLGCTRIVIAHRLETIAAADLIVVMEQGMAVEIGTHAELLALGGAYRALVTGEPAAAGASVVGPHRREG